jgi:hypothetical protein
VERKGKNYEPYFIIFFIFVPDWKVTYLAIRRLFVLDDTGDHYFLAVFNFMLGQFTGMTIGHVTAARAFGNNRSFLTTTLS